MNVGDIVELTIEKMVYEGYGLSRKDNMVFFVENVCDEDVVEAEIIKIKKNYIQAKLKKIIKPSKHRVEPFCPLHNACGGCQWQFISYEHQLDIKQKIVEEILKNSLKKDIKVEKTLPSPDIKEFRYKIQMPVSQTKNSKRFLIGYYKKQTHDITNIKYCPIQPDIINKIIEKIRIDAPIYGNTAYNEHNHKGEIRHIIFRMSESTKNILVCFVVNNNKISKPITDLAQSLFNEFENIKGISVNFNQKRGNVILGQDTKNLLGDKTYIEKLGTINYQISPESFFQVNPKSFKNILDKVKEILLKKVDNPTILDAYSGVGSFGLYLSDMAKSVTSVEEIKSACENEKFACELNKISNVEIVNNDAQKYFEELIAKDKDFDVVILDPPRKGCTQQALDYCAKLASKIIVYISCNPTSLARDLKYLEQYGFEPTFVQTADMFCHTYHVETITIIEKKQDLM